jgi:hypothetical protein
MQSATGTGMFGRTGFFAPKRTIALSGLYGMTGATGCSGATRTGRRTLLRSATLDAEIRYADRSGSSGCSGCAFGTAYASGIDSSGYA